jgi:lycopene beta-cyclase
MEEFDYIIAGTGAAGLQLAWFMSRDAWFDDKRILLIERDQKASNDRTWCFWERGAGEWDEVVSKAWDRVLFDGENFAKSFDLDQFKYKMIRSADFYKHVKSALYRKPNFTLVQEALKDFVETDDQVLVETDHGKYFGRYLFSSILTNDVIAKAKKELWLSQHFKGWFIKTATPVFEEKSVMMMDYSVEQKGNTRFMYVLPFSPNEALVEYTLFSAELLEESEYDDEIKKYLERKGCNDFQITETEMGQIPMTMYPFWQANSKRILFIGTAGGWTKASSGYTFYFSQKRSKSLCTYLKGGADLQRFHRSGRFTFYDRVMLDLLARRNDLGKQFFTSVYANQPIHRVLDFLNEETRLIDEVRIILRSQPRMELIRSVWRVLR